MSAILPIGECPHSVQCSLIDDQIIDARLRYFYLSHESRTDHIYDVECKQAYRGQACALHTPLFCAQSERRRSWIDQEVLMIGQV